MAAGRSGLLHATTGSGKTYAVWFGALLRAAALGVPLRGAQRAAARRALADADARARRRHGARDAARRCASSAPPGPIGVRTGDTPPRRARAAGPALADRAGHHARSR